MGEYTKIEINKHTDIIVDQFLVDIYEIILS